MIHSPMPADTCLFFSASDNHSSRFNDLMEVVDCLRSICREEFDMIGLPYLLLTKSSMSCDMVVTPSQYFLALLTRP